LGPTVCFRGIDNAIYYWLADDKRFYRNFTGTGQTINASHPVVRDMILDALRYWVMEMHIDGFRFDLASALGRDRDGRVLADAPLLERIAEDPILRDTKLIAERLLRPRRRSCPRKPDEPHRRFTRYRGSGRALSARRPSPGHWPGPINRGACINQTGAKCPTNFSLSRLGKEALQFIPSGLRTRPRQTEVCRTFGAAFH
jgi:hypothetical protein